MYLQRQGLGPLDDFVVSNLPDHSHPISLEASKDPLTFLCSFPIATLNYLDVHYSMYVWIYGFV